MQRECKSYASEDNTDGAINGIDYPTPLQELKAARPTNTCTAYHNLFHLRYAKMYINTS